MEPFYSEQTVMIVFTETMKIRRLLFNNPELSVILYKKN